MPYLVESPRLSLVSVIHQLYQPFARKRNTDAPTPVVSRHRATPAHHSDVSPEFLYEGVTKGWGEGEGGGVLICCLPESFDH